ncbi:MAG: hypothetical protein WCJ69_17560 [Betaproteobacteria bacterium]|jgi:hypothetical protein
MRSATTTIPNKNLRIQNIPADTASIDALESFAMTYNGYAECGSFERCADIANARDHGSLENLRTCLFFEIRRWHHFGSFPDAEAEAYLREVVARIRRIVDERDQALAAPPARPGP